MCLTTLLGTGHPLMRFAPPGSAILKDLLRSPHPTAQWTEARTSPAYEQRGPTRSCFREDLYAFALSGRSSVMKPGAEFRIIFLVVISREAKNLVTLVVVLPPKIPRYARDDSSLRSR